MSTILKEKPITLTIIGSKNDILLLPPKKPKHYLSPLKQQDLHVSNLAQNLHGSEIIKIAGKVNEPKKKGEQSMYAITTELEIFIKSDMIHFL